MKVENINGVVNQFILKDNEGNSRMLLEGRTWSASQGLGPGVSGPMTEKARGYREGMVDPNARLKDMFTLINAHLKSIGRDKLLPAGIVITGGGSGIVAAPDIARSVLQLPAHLSHIAQNRTSVLDATWAVSYGLCRWGFAEDTPVGAYSLSSISKGAFDSVRHMLRSLLP